MHSKIVKWTIMIICVSLVQSFNPCSLIQFNDYSFDLTGLKNFTIPFPDNLNYAKITPCYITSCDNGTNIQKSFVLKSGSNTCQPYTSIFFMYFS